MIAVLLCAGPTDMHIEGYFTVHWYPRKSNSLKFASLHLNHSN